MAALADRPGTGCVGAKLHYPDGRIQHGGVIVGMGRVAGHAHLLWPGDDPGYCGRLLLRRDIFLEVGGLNERDLAVAFNDVDLCLKVQAAGYANCWTPFARLIHHESVSRGQDDTPEKRARFLSEVAYMQRVWNTPDFADPAYHPALSLSDESYRMRRETPITV